MTIICPWCNKALDDSEAQLYTGPGGIAHTKLYCNCFYKALKVVIDLKRMKIKRYLLRKENSPFSLEFVDRPHGPIWGLLARPLRGELNRTIVHTQKGIITLVEAAKILDKYSRFKAFI